MTVRTPLTTERGMRTFLKDIYLKPERWGIRISDEFNEEARSEIHSQIMLMNAILDIEPDNSMALSVVPNDHKYHSLGIISLNIFCSVYFLYAYLKGGAHASLFKHLSLINFASGLLMLCAHILASSKGVGTYHKNQIKCNFSQEAADSKVPTHEYVHFLKDIGILKNEITASSYESLMQVRTYGKVFGKTEAYEKGLLMDARTLLAEKLHFKVEKEKTYKIGTRLAGLAVQLSTKLNDPKAKWDFLNIVSCSDKDELFPNLFNSKFKQFFE